ncbi:MAG TPA: hypothetical protein VLG37_00720 [Candidatus Saccharimonadales bacterium]|nr:hypothetical protein [Candidatus Saccharimonadales bacterium]
MDLLADLLQESKLQALATPANFKHGQEISEAGEVIFSTLNSREISAKVGGHLTQPRQVSLLSTNQGLVWHCTCTTDPKKFCKHAVAAALESQQKALES